MQYYFKTNISKRKKVWIGDFSGSDIFKLLSELTANFPGYEFSTGKSMESNLFGLYSDLDSNRVWGIIVEYFLNKRKKITVNAR
jgi:hypothetical protein